jgi:DNA-binding transcriptional MerR regulator
MEFTSRTAAKAAGLHQRTVIKWSDEGFVVPSEPRNTYEPRVYSEQDVAALMLAKVALEYGWPREDVAEMVEMAQKSDEKQQRNAGIVAFKAPGMEAGFVRQVWTPNVKHPKEARSIKSLEEKGLLIQQVSLYDLVQIRLKIIHKRYSEEGMRERETNADADDEDAIF